MKSDASQSAAELNNPQPAAPVLPIAIWPAVTVLATYSTYLVVFQMLDLPIYAGFFSMVISSAVLLLLLSIWWLTRGAISRRDKFLTLAAAIVGGLIVTRTSDYTVGGMAVVLLGPAVVGSAWVLWLLVARRRSPTVLRAGLLIAPAIVWALFLVVRTDGVDGAQQAKLHWRWTPTAEDLFLSQRAQSGSSIAPASPSPDAASEPLVAGPGDWTEFRGPARAGVLSGVRIATDWNDHPPQPLWRQRVGPAWSSVVIVGDRLFTQEQRGDSEAAICLDAASGREIWVHADPVRFFDGQAGAGPRSTPTFADGRLYTQGATGIVNCLDAATGRLLWTRNLVTDTAAPTPMWGFSSSPLVAEDTVIVFAGAENDKGLLAYRAATGDLAWTAPTGPVSYSSPQLITLGPDSQILLLSDHGLVAVDAATGVQRWAHEAVRSGIWRVVQPRQLAANQVLIGSEDLGLVLLDLTHADQSWSAAEPWASRAMRPAYNDLVTDGGSAYGFDGGMLCCVDLETGKRRWKAGRYGHGQVLLIADQKLLLVLTETGEAVLVAANPEAHQEIGRFQALEGKTWNHPVIAHGRLYTRNDAEMACYQLTLADAE